MELIKNKYPDCFVEDGDNAQLLLDKMEPEAFDEIMNIVHTINIATEDKLVKKIKPEWSQIISYIKSEYVNQTISKWEVICFEYCFN